MSWELLLWLLALCALLALVVQLLRFLRADADLTLLWAEWQGRRPGEDLLPPVCTGSPVPCGRISAAPAFIRVAWSFRAARMRLSQGLWFGVEGAGAFCLPSRSLRTCFYLLKLKSLGIGGGAFRSLSSPPGSQGF